MPSNFDIGLMSFGQIKQLTSGGRTIYISYAGKNLLMQTPFMKAPFGIKKWEGESGAPDKYNLDLSLDGAESREPVRHFFEALKAIDQRLLQDAFDNSQTWFKKKYASIDVIEALYTPTIKYSKDRDTGEINNKYAPTFKMLLPMKDGQFVCDAFGARREKLDLHDIIQTGRSKGARMQVIVQCSSIWMVGTKFGVSWKVRQVKIEEPVCLTGYAFVSTEEDAPEDDETEDKRPSAPAVAAPAVATAGNVMAESDDEADPPL